MRPGWCSRRWVDQVAWLDLMCCWQAAKRRLQRSKMAAARRRRVRSSRGRTSLTGGVGAGASCGGDSAAGARKCSERGAETGGEQERAGAARSSATAGNAARALGEGVR
eukprot:720673-Hanusia_phi.AAC.1